MHFKHGSTRLHTTASLGMLKAVILIDGVGHSDMSFFHDFLWKGMKRSYASFQASYWYTRLRITVIDKTGKI